MVKNELSINAFFFITIVYIFSFVFFTHLIVMLYNRQYLYCNSALSKEHLKFLEPLSLTIQLFSNTLLINLHDTVMRKIKVLLGLNLRFKTFLIVFIIIL